MKESDFLLNAREVIRSIARITQDLKNRGYPDEWIEWKLEGIVRDLDISDEVREDRFTPSTVSGVPTRYFGRIENFTVYSKPLTMTRTKPLTMTRKNIQMVFEFGAKVLKEQDDKL